MATDVLVLGLDDDNEAMLRRLPGGEDYHFHALLSVDDLRGVDEFPFDDLLAEAERRLETFAVQPDAIVTFIDFPATAMLPVLAQRLGLPGPSLEGQLRCAHKYWSRLLQDEVIPEHVPAFAVFDPYADDAFDRVGLDPPFWIKPVTSFRSALGFRIDSRDDFRGAMAHMRADLPKLADPLAQVLRRLRLPEEIGSLPSTACLAESIIGGWQCTCEGYVQGGRAVVYGIVDSVRVPGQSSFSRYEYPSRLPRRVQTRMRDLVARVMNHIGLDDCPFNVELFWDRSQDRIWLLEINTRISQSHCRLFELVDGVSHHRVMLDVALGRPPWLPHREGAYRVAAKHFVRSFHDAVVAGVPPIQARDAVRERWPGSSVHLLVDEGMRLSELEDQDSYSYELATVELGAPRHEELVRRLREAEELLAFGLEPDG